jgi:hypothetical protein
MMDCKELSSGFTIRTQNRHPKFSEIFTLKMGSEMGHTTFLVKLTFIYWNITGKRKGKALPVTGRGGP